MAHLKQWGWNRCDSFTPEGRCQLVACNEEQNTMPQLNDSHRKEKTMYANPFCLELCIEPAIPGNVIYRKCTQPINFTESKANLNHRYRYRNKVKVQVYHHLIIITQPQCRPFQSPLLRQDTAGRGMFSKQ